MTNRLFLLIVVVHGCSGDGTVELSGDAGADATTGVDAGGGEDAAGRPDGNESGADAAPDAGAADCPWLWSGTELHAGFTIDVSDDDLAALLADPEQSEYVPATFSDGVVTLRGVGVKFKGSSSLANAGAKKPLRVDFDRFVDDEQRWCGLESIDLNNGWADPTFARESTAYWILRRAGVAASRTQYVERVTLAGQDLGLYSMVERVDARFLRDRFDDDSGHLYKVYGGRLEYLGPDAADYRIPGFHQNPMYELKHGDEADSHADIVPLVSSLAFADAADLPDELAQLLDLDGWYSLFAVESALSDFDSPVGDANNHYLWIDGAGRARLLPWDLNGAFGGWNCFVEEREGVWLASVFDPVCPGFSLPLVARTVATPELGGALADRLRDLRAGALATTTILDEIDRVHDLIAPAYATDPVAFFSPDDFERSYDEGVDGPGGGTPGLRPFVRERMEVVDDQIAATD